MLPVHDVALFVGAALLLNLTPGPDMLFVAGTAASRGRRAGLLAALGVGAGCLFHTVLAAVGLSALLAASDLAFTAVKWAGAAYLVWTGLTMLRARGDAARPSSVGTARSGNSFWQGALTNALNPKVALFFLAFLPQFVDPSRGSVLGQFMLLGASMAVLDTLYEVVLVLVAARLRERLLRNRRFVAWQNRVTGAALLALGVRLAVQER
jgi:RhtB (resistance to homoserine/threonine) family protein